jgi:hypothetical protein
MFLTADVLLKKVDVWKVGVLEVDQKEQPVFLNTMRIHLLIYFQLTNFPAHQPLIKITNLPTDQPLMKITNSPTPFYS